MDESKEYDDNMPDIELGVTPVMEAFNKETLFAYINKRHKAIYVSGDDVEILTTMLNASVEKDGTWILDYWGHKGVHDVTELTSLDPKLTIEEGDSFARRRKKCVERPANFCFARLTNGVFQYSWKVNQPIRLCIFGDGDCVSTLLKRTVKRWPRRGCQPGLGTDHEHVIWFCQIV